MTFSLRLNYVVSRPLERFRDCGEENPWKEARVRVAYRSFSRVYIQVHRFEATRRIATAGHIVCLHLGKSLLTSEQFITLVLVYNCTPKRRDVLVFSLSTLQLQQKPKMEAGIFPKKIMSITPAL